MLFTKLAVLALPFIGSVFGSPIVKKDELSIEKRDSIVTVITNFQNQVNGPVASLKAANNGNILTANDAQVYLKDILNAIQVAQTGVGSASTKRDLGELASELQARQEADLQIVGAVLAEVIQDIVEAVEGIVDDLRALPLVGALIIAIDGGLTTLLLGVQVVLVGVLQIVAGLLGGVLGLVQSLGLSLLAGLLLGA